MFVASCVSTKTISSVTGGSIIYLYILGCKITIENIVQVWISGHKRGATNPPTISANHCFN